MSIVQISKLINRSGNLVDLSPGVLSAAEIGFASDANQLFIGTTSGGIVEVLTSASEIDFGQISGAGGVGLNIVGAVQDGQILAYDSATGDWTNKGNTGGGLVNLGNVSNVRIGEGAVGYVLETDGYGNVSWTSKGTIVAPIEAISAANPGIMTVDPAIPYVNFNEVTISGVGGTNANALVNGQSFFIKVAVDYPTSGNVELYLDALCTIPLDTTTLVATAFTGQAVSRVGSLANFAGGSNTTIQINNSGILDGSADLKFNPVTRLLSVTGNAAVSGNTTTGNLAVSGNSSFGNIAVTGNIDASNFNGGNYSGANMSLTGNASITGNISGGNLSTTGNMSAANFVGGNYSGANMSLTGNASIAGNASVTGNISGGNLSTTGNINAANFVGGNYSGANMSLTGNIGAGGNIVATGNMQAGNISTTGNMDAGNYNGGNYFGSNMTLIGNIDAMGNVSAGNFSTAGNIDVTKNIRGGNVSGSNLALTGNASITGNLSSGNISTTGNIDGANLNLTGNADITGNLDVTGNISAGNLSGNFSGTVAAPGLNTQVIFNNSGNLGADAGLTYDSGTDLLTVAGNVDASNVNITNLVSTVTANISGDLNVDGKSNLNAVGNVTITGGAAGQVLTTDGAGVLSWTAPVAGSVTNAATFNNGGAGAASGTTYNGSVARTISYNTVGAAVASNTTNYYAEGISDGANLQGMDAGAGTIYGTWSVDGGSSFTSAVADISITGGAAGEVLTTDGAGVLSWTVPTAGSLTNAATFNNGGTGAASGTTFNGSAARTISYNTVGAASASNTTNYYAKGISNAANTQGMDASAGTIYGTWTLTGGSSLQATYADIAEAYISDRLYEPGTVVAIGGEKEVTEATIESIFRIAGVVSTKPAYVLNSMAPNSVNIALVGRVPCKVIGRIYRGDFLTISAIPGVACRASFPPVFGTIIGRALEEYNSDNVGIIEIKVDRG